MASQGLYYPWIDVRDEGWLKTSLLYWDSLRTIVPESIDNPYSSDTARLLEAAGYLAPLRVNSQMEEIEELDDVVFEQLESQAASLLIANEGGGGAMSRIHLQKLSPRLSHLWHHLPHLRLGHLGGTGRDGWAWMDERLAAFYMTLLASRLAERVGASVVTSTPAAEGLAISTRFDAPLGGLVTREAEGPGPWRRWREYGPHGPRRRVPRTFAPGMLAHLAVERILIDPDTSVDTLLAFRESHRDELAAFRSKLEQLAASVADDLPAEALHQRVQDIYAGEVAPAVSNLRAALAGRRIRAWTEGLMKVAFLSAAPTSAAIVAGLSVPVALLAGTAVSLVVQGVMFNVERAEALRANPFSYLLSVERELPRRRGR